jgi:hypothetical protein
MDERSDTMNNPRIGSSFESFLEEERIREEVEDLGAPLRMSWGTHWVCPTWRAIRLAM